MKTRSQLAISTLAHPRQLLRDNIRGLTLDEALHAAGGYRSILGILKHTASWSHVYHSYAFDPEPKHLRAVGWPRSLQDTIETSEAYLSEVVAWFEQSADLWSASLEPLPDEAFDEPRPLHWGETLPLFDIVVLVAMHWSYHAGELNEILAILRGEAWTYTEEVEENHISTAGHRLKPDWMSQQQVEFYEAHLARRDKELHGGGD